MFVPKKEAGTRVVYGLILVALTVGMIFVIRYVPYPLDQYVEAIGWTTITTIMLDLIFSWLLAVENHQNIKIKKPGDHERIYRVYTGTIRAIEGLIAVIVTMGCLAWIICWFLMFTNKTQEFYSVLVPEDTQTQLGMGLTIIVFMFISWVLNIRWKRKKDYADIQSTIASRNPTSA